MIYCLGDCRVELCGENYYIVDNVIVIGLVILENDVSIWFNCVVCGDNDLILIGEGSNI